jgi:hypothetical protein
MPQRPQAPCSSTDCCSVAETKYEHPLFAVGPYDSTNSERRRSQLTQHGHGIDMPFPNSGSYSSLVVVAEPTVATQCHNDSQQVLEASESDPVVNHQNNGIVSGCIVPVPYNVETQHAQCHVDAMTATSAAAASSTIPHIDSSPPITYNSSGATSTALWSQCSDLQVVQTLPEHKAVAVATSTRAASATSVLPEVTESRTKPSNVKFRSRKKERQAERLLFDNLRTVLELPSVATKEVVIHATADLIENTAAVAAKRSGSAPSAP